MLELPKAARDELVAHCLGAYPHEGCGLLVGSDDRVVSVVPTANAARSALRYVIDPSDVLVADRDAAARGLDLLGAFHSHTHTDAYPSPTDVAQAVDPNWHWVLVSLKEAAPAVRSFSIRDGVVEEEALVVVEGE